MILDLDRLFRTGDFEQQETETFSYFGLQLKASYFGRAESLKKSTPFEMEKSMHIGENDVKIF